MLPESKFALILASIATTFCFALVTMFSTYMYLKKESLYERKSTRSAFSGSGSQFKGLNNFVTNR